MLAKWRRQVSPMAIREAYLHTPVQPSTTYKSVKIAAIHSNRTTLTLTLNPKLKITLTLKRRCNHATGTTALDTNHLLTITDDGTSWFLAQPEIRLPW